MRWRRIYDAFMGLETKMEVEADQLQALWIDNVNGVLIFLDIAPLTVTLYRICLVSVSF